MPQTSQPPPAGTGAHGPAADVQAKVSDAAEQAQEKAQQAAGQAQERLREQLDQRSAQAARQITEQATDLRSVSATLREQGKEGPAKVADRLADYAEKVGGYLHEKDADGLLADAEAFGRRQPWVVTAGGLALGIAASRFLKASSRQRYQARAVPVRAGTSSRAHYSGQLGNGHADAPPMPRPLGTSAAPVA